MSEHSRKAGAFVEPVAMTQFSLLLGLLCIPVGDGLVKPEALNKKAIQIINRVRDKLTGEYVCGHVYLPGHKICVTLSPGMVVTPNFQGYWCLNSALNWSVSETNN